MSPDMNPETGPETGPGMRPETVPGMRPGLRPERRSTSCPYCGYPLTTAEPARRAVDGDTIEALSQEIRQLRETVARLRGAGDGRTAAASPEPRTPEDV